MLAAWRLVVKSVPVFEGVLSSSIFYLTSIDYELSMIYKRIWFRINLIVMNIHLLNRNIPTDVQWWKIIAIITGVIPLFPNWDSTTKSVEYFELLIFYWYNFPHWITQFVEYFFITKMAEVRINILSTKRSVLFASKLTMIDRNKV